jgi:cytochrome c-type biogenesis protein CcmH
MSELFLFAIPLAGLAAALLVLPLWRRKKSAATRADFDLAVFRDQLAEIERDAERGLLEAKQVEAARLEVQRRILARADEAERASIPSPFGRRIVLAAAVGAPVAAALVYLFVGAPGMPDFPFASRPDAPETAARASAEAQLREQIPDLNAALARLEERLRREPDDQRGWLMLGRTYMTLEKYPEAAAAFARAHVLDRDPRTATEEAEALILANNRSVPPLALKILAEVLEQDPREPRARYYVGIAKAQAGDFKGAAQEWTDLIALSPADAEWTPMVREQIEAVAKELGVRPNSFAPSAAAQALAKGGPPAPAATSPAAPAPAPPTAALPAGQEEMIRGMVGRLAERLKENPNDPDGWRMLARSYEIMGETEKAKEARAKAEALSRKQGR